MKRILLALVALCGLVAPASACNITHAAFVGSSFAFVTPFVPQIAVTSFVPSYVAAPAVAAVATPSCASAAVAAPVASVAVAAPVVSAVAVPFVQTAVIASPFIVRERFIGSRAVILNRRPAVVVGGRGRVVQRTVIRGR